MTHQRTEYYYARDSYRRSFDTRIARAGETEGRTWFEPEETVLYPEGGGQGADRGRLIVRDPATDSESSFGIDDVQKIEGVPRHFLAPDTSSEAAMGLLVAGAEVRLELDWQRRFDHMQQHSAQHLLSAIAEDRFGWTTTAFHLGAEISDIELATASLDASQLAELEEAVAEQIRKDLAIVITQRLPDKVDFSRIRSRGLPDDHEGLVRLVSISGVDISTCGGTHLRSTAEIESLKLLDTSSMRGGTRLHWVAGGRARRRFGRHEARNAELRKVLGAGDEDLVEIARAKLEQAKELTRKLKAAEGRWADAAAAALGARLASGASEGPVHEHFEGIGAGPLGQVARAAVELAPHGLLIATASESNDGDLYFMAAKGAEHEIEIDRVGKAVADALGGRGGGKGRFFQGRAPSSSRADLGDRLAKGLDGI